MQDKILVVVGLGLEMYFTAAPTLEEPSIYRGLKMLARSKEHTSCEVYLDMVLCDFRSLGFSDEGCCTYRQIISSSRYVNSRSFHLDSM